MVRLNFNQYEKILKEIIEKNDKSNFNYLISSPIFIGVDKDWMMRKFYNFFIFDKIEQNRKLIVENNSADDVYFIKSGAFNLSIKTSLNSLDELITYFGGTDKVKEIKKIILSKNNDLKLNKMLQEKQNFNVKFFLSPFSFLL